MSSAVSTSKPRVSGMATASAADLRDLRDQFVADPEGTDLSILRPVIARPTAAS